ncbi:MAG TPA: PIG-L family deacetylase [Thermoanaerobaculia bacterium]|jgi:LmbE family N-acetylglucosaminyl deacetylase
MMNRSWLALSFSALFLLGTEAGGRERPAPRVPPTFPGVASVLWIGAHPDDEVLAAPLLARLCLDERLRCSFLVLTRGEQGPCFLPGGCRPDLAAVRSAEMARAARLFNAQLTLWDLPDGGAAPDGSAGAWAAAAGTHEALLASLREFIAGTGPDLVLTFDARHGSTCHPDHRAVGNLVVEALAGAERRPLLYLLETRLVIGDSPVTLRFPPAASAAAGVFSFDGNSKLLSTRRPAWQVMVQDLLTHASQFDAPLRRAIQEVPAVDRAVFLGPADLLLLAKDVWSCP